MPCRRGREQPMNSDVATNAGPVRTTVAPMLSVRQGARAVEFYKEAFGATEVLCYGTAQVVTPSTE